VPDRALALVHEERRDARLLVEERELRDERLPALDERGDLGDGALEVAGEEQRLREESARVDVVGIERRREARVLEGAGRLPRRGVLLPDEQVRLAERAIGEGQVRIAAARGLEQLEALPRPARARDPQDPARAQELRRLAPARALARALLVPPGLELPAAA
jgi:hypothetical protein